MNKRETGTRKEQLAAAYLIRQGCRILKMNYRCRVGEIDMIILDQHGCLCFVEVKYRRTSAAGYPQEAVNLHKQYTICRVADFYRLCYRIGEERSCRFDVVAVLGEQITWEKNAFQYIPIS